MILTFQAMGELIRFRVNEVDRDLYMSGKNTNNEWLLFERAVDATKQDGKVAELTKKIIKSLPTIEDVEEYIIFEVKKMGLEHLRTEK